MILLENSMLKKEYLVLFIFLIFVIFLTVLIIGVSYLVARQIPESEKLSAYECGFEPYEDTRHTFDIRFCVIAILFIERALEKLFTGFNWQIAAYKLKGLVLYCDCVLESILRVVFSIIDKVTLFKQKALVNSLSKILIHLKKNGLCVWNLRIVFLFYFKYSCFIWQQLFQKLRKSKISKNFAGYINGIWCKCTSYNRFLFVAGETRQYFSILIKKLDNELVSGIKNIKKVEANRFLNDNRLFKRATAENSLKKAWVFIRSKYSMFLNQPSALRDVWFINTANKLLEGSFKYPSRIRLSIQKSSDRRIPLSILNIKTKVIEQALFSALEPQFEGYYVWENIPKEIYLWKSKQNKICSNYKMVVYGSGELYYFKKHVICPTVFYPNNYGFRRNKSAHQALKAITHWKLDTTFLIDYAISTIFSCVNQNRLKNIFKKIINDSRFWNEITKILTAGVVYELQFIFESKGVVRGSILSPFLWAQLNLLVRDDVVHNWFN